nr:hypothetical protein 7 [Alphaproteobacteria bacterium]
MHMHEQDYPALCDYHEEERPVVIRNILDDVFKAHDGPLHYEDEDIATITDNVIAMQKELAQAALLQQSQFFSKNDEQIDPRLLALETKEDAPLPN